MRFSQSLTLGALILGAATASAQVTPRRFAVSPRGGYLSFEKASGLEGTPVIGLDAMYAFNRYFMIGTGLSAARPSTRGQDFIASLTFGDTTLLVEVKQPVTLLDVNLAAMLRWPGATFSPYFIGSVGSYTLYLDQQVVGSNRKFSKLSATAGVGVNYRVSEGAGLQLDVRDFIFTDYDRDQLNPAAARFANIRFPEDVPVPPAAKKTVHNLMFSLGFSFTPTLAGGTPEEETTP
ncbi:MAG: outer membrane beta-barrel protein [Gemmatimonadaceae bacterium]